MQSFGNFDFHSEKILRQVSSYVYGLKTTLKNTNCEIYIYHECLLRTCCKFTFSIKDGWD